MHLLSDVTMREGRGDCAQPRPSSRLSGAAGRVCGPPSRDVEHTPVRAAKSSALSGPPLLPSLQVG